MGERDAGEAERRLLDRLLGQLYQCEDPEVDGKKNKRKKPKLKGRKGEQKEPEEKIVCSESQPVPCTNAVPRTSDLHTKKTVISSGQTPKCLVRLRRELLDSEDDQTVSTKEEGGKEPDDQNVTVGQKRPVEVVCFTSAHTKGKHPPVTDKLSKARLEVHRFGITGYKKEQQRILEQERAIMLGARPPKREYVNYKTYQEMMKNKSTAKQMKMNSKLAPSREKKTDERRNKKADKVLSGQLGRFKNGALILSDNDIKKLKCSSKSKHT
ncbi:uncharacterized protein C1orf131 homolog isoform X2 [Pristis pectinata]|uniref:uncharacterized protein C1orf131 homolog isoform X2 n=1 Tax=Pristis pectinata TaxID=685728 RepID=UPI00223DD212|nr:uncharacterized protein C1orf131 homolog isoform X2 [Pristis pectinata]